MVVFDFSVLEERLERIGKREWQKIAEGVVVAFKRAADAEGIQNFPSPVVEDNDGLCFSYRMFDFDILFFQLNATKWCGSILEEFESFGGLEIIPELMSHLSLLASVAV